MYYLKARTSNANVIFLNREGVLIPINVSNALSAKTEIKTEIKTVLQEKNDIFRRLLFKSRIHSAFDHNISNSIIEQAEIENADIIIMGWRELKRFKYPFGGDVTMMFSSPRKAGLLS